MHIEENISILRDMITSAHRMVPLRKLKLVERRHEYENVVTFVFKPKKSFSYKAGQYGVLMFPRLIKGKPVRLFSLASSPSEETIQFSTHISDSDYKQKLDKLKIGATAYFKGPVGQFVLEDDTKHAVFIAGGIGMTAVHSVVKDIYDNQLPTKTTVIHSAGDDYLYQKDIRTYADEAYFVTRETLLRTIEKQVANTGNEASYYVSGPPAFVDAVVRQLKKLGITNIQRDGFLGY